MRPFVALQRSPSAFEMIEIEGLVRRFGPLTAVGGISLRVAKGEVLGFLGPNGAGKSTTMKMITGFLAPSEGRITVCGYDVVEEPMKAQAAIGYLPEGAPAYPDMTPKEFLSFIATVRGLKDAAAKSAIDTAVARTGLGSVLDQRIETLSKGFKRRVGLAQAILHEPAVLIMDEPTDGLDPNQKHAARALIKAMSPEKAIIISTHILEEVEAVCTRAIIIDKGLIVADGTPGELLNRAPSHKLDDVFRSLTTPDAEIKAGLAP
jgi:ABC-2 type transport system ATP-binding protein